MHLALKPCCLPGLAFVERGDTFKLGGQATLTLTLALNPQRLSLPTDHWP